MITLSNKKIIIVKDPTYSPTYNWSVWANLDCLSYCTTRKEARSVKFAIESIWKAKGYCINSNTHALINGEIVAK